MSVKKESAKAVSRQGMSLGRKAWLHFRWMLLALVVAGLLVWAGVSAGDGIAQNVLIGGAVAIMLGIGLWTNATQGEIYRRSAPMNVPFVGKEEEPAMARWGTENGFNPEGTRPTYVESATAVPAEPPSAAGDRR